MPWAAIYLVIVAGFGAYLRFVSGDPLPVDLWWHGLIGVSRGSAPFAIAVFFAEIGGTVGAAACVAIGAALLLALRRPRDAAALVTALVLGVLASEGIKALVLRTRPWDQLYASSGSSYPSGHSMAAAALAVSLALAVPSLAAASSNAVRWAWIGAAAWTLLMMWSRTALHVHWLSDTFAGALLGFAAAVIARRIWVPPDGSPASGVKKVPHSRE